MSDVNISVSIETNKDAIKEASDEAIARALEMIGMQAENYAVMELEKPKEHGDGTIRPNVQTGRLVGSITHQRFDETTEAIGTNVEYAAYVELGTSKSRAYPYLTPAVTEHVNEYQQMVEECLHNA